MGVSINLRIFGVKILPSTLCICIALCPKTFRGNVVKEELTSCVWNQIYLYMKKKFQKLDSIFFSYMKSEIKTFPSTLCSVNIFVSKSFQSRWFKWKSLTFSNKNTVKNWNRALEIKFSLTKNLLKWTEFHSISCRLL